MKNNIQKDLEKGFKNGLMYNSQPACLCSGLRRRNAGLCLRCEIKNIPHTNPALESDMEDAIKQVKERCEACLYYGIPPIFTADKELKDLYDKYIEEAVEKDRLEWESKNRHEDEQ